MKIKNLKAREILNSRGNFTVEVELSTDLGKFFASVPCGASRGKYEAKELRADKAVKNIEQIIALKIKNKDIICQKEIDELMIKLDGTKNKSRLGANAILAVSMAFCRARAAAKNVSLFEHIAQLTKNYSPLSVPFPCFNVINGGAHAGNDLDFQEFMLVPQIKPFSKALKIGCEIYEQLKQELKKKYGNSSINVGDEGGFAPPIKYPEDALNIIMKAVEQTGHENKIKIILDVAASQFFQNKKYKTIFGNFSDNGLLRYYSSLIKKYPIIAIEDPFAEDDWQGWKMLMSNVKCQMSNVFIIGDDLTVTNLERLKQAKEKNACNGIIIKPNQIGTVTEAIRTAKLAKSFGWKVIASHRSAETNDDFIADFTVGIGADFIKAGAPARGERVAKYNRLLKIEQEIQFTKTKATPYTCPIVEI